MRCKDPSLISLSFRFEILMLYTLKMNSLNKSHDSTFMLACFFAQQLLRATAHKKNMKKMGKMNKTSCVYKTHCDCRAKDKRLHFIFCFHVPPCILEKIFNLKTPLLSCSPPAKCFWAMTFQRENQPHSSQFSVYSLKQLWKNNQINKCRINSLSNKWQKKSWSEGGFWIITADEGR